MYMQVLGVVLELISRFILGTVHVSNGDPVTNPRGVPYMVSVQLPVIMCSGVLVSPRVVLTTATCVNTLLPSDIEVYLGSNQYYNNNYKAAVESYTQHPLFNKKGNYSYNIAVLYLKEPVSAATAKAYNISPIAIATALPAADSSVSTFGFGATDTSLSLPTVLQSATLQTYSFKACNAMKSNQLTPDMFCAGDPTGKKDLCPADQGAPLIFNNTLIGIYSWGCSCGLAAPTSPSSPVFVSIPLLRNWIVATASSN